MSLGNVGGLIGTAVGLAVLVGVAGLAFKAIDRTFPDGDRRKKNKRRDDGLFGGFGSGSTDLIGGKPSKNRSQQNIFDLGLTQRPSGRTRKTKFRSDVGSDFNIFAV